MGRRRWLRSHPARDFLALPTPSPRPTNAAAALQARKRPSLRSRPGRPHLHPRRFVQYPASSDPPPGEDHQTPTAQRRVGGALAPLTAHRQHQHPTGRVTRFDATGRRPVDKWITRKREFPTYPQAPQPQQKRSIHVLRKAANLNSYRQLSGLGLLCRGRRDRARGLKLKPPSLQLRWRHAELRSHTGVRRSRIRLERAWRTSFVRHGESHQR